MSWRPNTAPAPSRSISASYGTEMEADRQSQWTENSRKRFESKHFNVLKKTSRFVAPESMRLQNVGIDGLYRYDIPPNQRRTQGMLHGVYMGELKKKENPHGGPIFTIHGLRNFSSIPLGDMRVNRTVSTLRESYLDPADRAFHAPRFDHVQDGEEVDNDGTLGPPVSDIETHPSSSKHARETKQKRQHYYREVVEAINPTVLDRQEKLLREKLHMYAVKGSNYALRSTFRFFDREAKGSINLEGFKEAIRLLGLDYDSHCAAALFSRFDTTCSGFISYHEYVNYLLGRTVLTNAEIKKLNAQVRATIGTIRASSEYHKMGQSSMAAAVAADGTLKQSDVVTVDVHSLSDMAFLFRQRIRHLFMILDENSTGTLSRDEIFRLLRHHLKCSITIPESNAVFEYIDHDADSCITFEEFYSWYTTNIE